MDVWNDNYVDSNTTGSAGGCTFKIIDGEYQYHADVTIDNQDYKKEGTFVVLEDMTLNIGLEMVVDTQ